MLRARAKASSYNLLEKKNSASVKEERRGGGRWGNIGGGR